MRTAPPTPEELSSKEPWQLRGWAANCRKKVLELTQKEFLSKYEEELMDLMVAKIKAIDEFLATPQILSLKEKQAKRKAEVLNLISQNGEKPKEENNVPPKKRAYTVAYTPVDAPAKTLYHVIEGEEALSNAGFEVKKKDWCHEPNAKAPESSGWEFNEKGD